MAQTEDAADQAALHWSALGLAAYRAHDYGKAITYFSKALALVPHQIVIIDNLAESYKQAGRYTQAEQCLQAALRGASTPETRRHLENDLADLQFIWAYALGTKGKHEEALVHYKAALTSDRVARPSNARGDMTQMGTENEALNRYTVALGLFAQVLALHRAAKDPLGETAALMDMGDAYMNLNHPEKALACFNQAQAISDASGQPGEQAGITISRAHAYADIGQDDARQQKYDQAIDADDEALKLLRHLTGVQRQVGLTLQDQGGDYAAVQQYARAISCFQEALSDQTRPEDREDRGHTLYSLGYVYYCLYQMDKASACYQQALDIALQLHKPAEAEGRLNDLGIVAQYQHDPQRELDFYQRSLVLSKEASQPQGTAITLSNIGGVYARLQQYPAAIHSYQQALALERRLNMREEQGETLDDLGHVYNEIGESSEAVDSLNHALLLLHEAQRKDVEANVLDLLMQIWSQRKRTSLAVFYGKQAVNEIQQIRHDNSGLDKGLQQSFLQPRIETYRLLAELLIQQGRLPEAEQVLDLLKDQEFFDFVRRDAQNAPQNGTLDRTAAEADWSTRYLMIADRVTAIGRERETLLARWRLAAQGGAAFTDADRRNLAAIDSDLTVADQAFQAFLRQLASEFSADPVGHARVDTVKDAAALSDTLGELGPGAVALYTIVEPDKYRVVLVTSQTQKTEEYPITAAALNEKIARFRDALQDPAIDPRPLAHELYTILFCGGKLAQDLDGAGAQTLMWSLDGTLRYLPMAALYDGHQYLVERYGNEVFTPASDSRLTEAPQAHWAGLGLGVSEAEPGFPALPGVPAELGGVIHDMATGGAATGGILPGTILLNGQFTEDKMVTALEGQRYPVVHVASHFSFHPGGEADSFLLLGDGSHLSLAQIKTLPRVFQGVDLLMLSACDTAVGSTGADGQEVEGFGVIAQRQGAKAVIASLWPVADQSTPLLMRQFYRLREATPGTTKSEALRQAQLSLLCGTAPPSPGGLPAPGRGTSVDNDPADVQAPPFTPDPKMPYAHPFYWAPFVLIGNWR